MDVEVTRNCGGDFPKWEREVQPGGISFKTPEMCHTCDFQTQCNLILSAPLLGMSELAPQTEEAEIIMAKMEKVTKMWSMGEITEDEMLQHAVETQRKITDLNL